MSFDDARAQGQYIVDNFCNEPISNLESWLDCEISALTDCIDNAEEEVDTDLEEARREVEELQDDNSDLSIKLQELEESEGESADELADATIQIKDLHNTILRLQNELNILKK